VTDIRPGDIGAYLAQQSEAESELLRIYHPDEPLIIFDVGACEGEDSIRYARRFPRAHVYAFEPLPENQRLIRDNFDRYQVNNAELIPIALSDRDGSADFHVSSGRPKDEFSGRDWNYGNKSSSLLPPASGQPMFGWIEFKDTISVTCETLDHFCAIRGLAHVDFIHMDVQGAEHLVLRGAQDTLPHCGALWLEVSDHELYSGQKLRADLEALMRRSGFGLSLAVSRGDEGDQFYVNRRFGRMRRHLVRKRVEQVGRHLRGAASRFKRLLVPSP
jgi:2-O-methyltransferase